MKIITIIIGLLFAQSLIAQGTFYYPLNVGDKWQYFGIFPPEVSYWNYEIVSDTTMPNGHTYATYSNLGYYGSQTYQRQEGNLVLEYSNVDSQEYVLYDFSGSIGDTVGTYNQSGIIYYVVLQDTATRIIFGRSRRVITFNHCSRNGFETDHYWTVADSIGRYEFGGQIGTFNLRGAVIMGVSYGNIVSVKNEVPLKPSTIRLDQNFPNPFNSQTQISFSIDKTVHTQLEVFDILGRRIRVLINQILENGIHQFSFELGSLPSGVYIYRLSACGFTISRTMILKK